MVGILIYFFQWCRSRGIEWREKQSSTNKVFFVGNYVFFQAWTYKNVFFSRLLKDGLKSIWWIYWPGSGLDPDLKSSNFMDPYLDINNTDPHHWYVIFLRQDDGFCLCSTGVYIFQGWGSNIFSKDPDPTQLEKKIRIRP